MEDVSEDGGRCSYTDFFSMTNDQGPEKFAICGRPKNCGHTTTFCGLDFLYDGEHHKESCLSIDTPSAKDPQCRKLYDANDNVDRTIVNHIFDDGKYVTSCYPSRPPAGTTGWCTRTYA